MTIRHTQIHARRVQARSLEQQVYSQLRADILAGRLVAGQSLIEAQLSAEFGISKTPVREALIRLQRDGLVEIQLHRGARVIEPAVEDVEQVYQLRSWIESQIAWQLAQEQNPSVLAALKENLEASERALRAKSRNEYLKLIREFSDLLLEASGNEYAQDLLVRLRGLLAIIANASRRASGREERSVVEHRAIYEAIRSGDPEGAAQAAREHMASLERDSLGSFRYLDSGTGFSIEG